MSGTEEQLPISGFKAAAVQAGIRYQERLDLALIYSETPAVAAGVFTTNTVKAASVLLDMERIRSGQAQAILVNSGVANACTGDLGMAAARTTAAAAAQALGIDEELVLVCSTGVIGEQLPTAKIEQAVPALVADLTPDGFDRVARAIMTTDTVPKTASRSAQIGGRQVSLLGLAKGAGMIMPNMATMLAFVATDCAISAPVLQTLLQPAVSLSFNAITIDGDTSTNDTVLVLANGQAGNAPLHRADSADSLLFAALLTDLLQDLARQIVVDGEGATKLITVRVRGAADSKQAEQAARTVANSSLVKTAFFGEDANWGRIIAALGRSGVSFDPLAVDIAFGDVLLVHQGIGLGREAEAAATKALRRKEVVVDINLRAGAASHEILTCDLSVDYVKINANYRS